MREKKLGGEVAYMLWHGQGRQDLEKTLEDWKLECPCKENYGIIRSAREKKSEVTDR